MRHFPVAVAPPSAIYLPAVYLGHLSYWGAFHRQKRGICRGCSMGGRLPEHLCACNTLACSRNLLPAM